MAGPWEKYQKPSLKPWEKYAQKDPSPTKPYTGPEDPDWLQQAQQGAGIALKYAGEASDYLGGVTRTGAAVPVSQLRNWPTKVTGQDVINALKANPLSGKELLQRSGATDASLSDSLPIYSQGPKHWYQPEKGGPLDFTKLGTEGLALEMGTDPLALGGLAAKGIASAATKVGRALSPAEKVLQYATRPIGAALEDTGKYMYKSGFKKVDQVADKFNKIPASEVLFNEGITGTNKSVANQANDLIDKLRKQQAAILEQVDKSVPAANVDSALKPLKDRISAYRASKDPVKIEAANALEDDIKVYSDLKAKPEQTVTSQVPSSILDERGNPIMKSVSNTTPEVIAPSPSQLSGMKSSVQNSVPKKAYQEGLAISNPLYVSGRKDLGSGLRQAVEDAATQASPELGNALQQTNAKMGSLLSVGNTLDQEAMKGANKNIITSVDPIVMALEHGGGPMLPAKKAIDLSKTTWFRTNAGMGINNLGDRDMFLRRPSIWQNLINNQPQEDNQ